LNLPGTYRLYVEGSFSESFNIGEHQLLSATAASVVDYFRQMRAEDSNVWSFDASVSFYGGRSGTADVRGGWYDASGDISKYLSHLSYANFLNPQQIPLVAWALAYSHDAGASALQSLGLAQQVQTEALWGADYLVRVLDPAGYFYATVFDGWSGNVGDRRICAFSGSNGILNANYQAAMREGGGMSIAALARIAHWGVNSPHNAGRTSADYLNAAEMAWAHLNSADATYGTKSKLYADDHKDNVIDDYTGLLAASELYAATQDAQYLTAARSRAVSLSGRLEPTEHYFIADGASRPFWHASDAGLPVIALARYAEVETDAAQRAAAVTAIQQHLSYLVSVTNAVSNPYGYARQTFRSQSAIQTGFFIPHDNESNYWWQGEDARLASLSAAALIGGRVANPGNSGPLGVPADLAAYATRQLDWVLGANPYDACMLQGFGRNNPPAYNGSKPQGGTLTGGIANGITGSGTNGSGIQWNTSVADPQADGWTLWRWVEQWLPHSAWYLVAVTAQAQ